jgi:hypothetical protein
VIVFQPSKLGLSMLDLLASNKSSKHSKPFSQITKTKMRERQTTREWFNQKMITKMVRKLNWSKPNESSFGRRNWKT